MFKTHTETLIAENKLLKIKISKIFDEIKIYFSCLKLIENDSNNLFHIFYKYLSGSSE